MALDEFGREIPGLPMVAAESSGILLDDDPNNHNDGMNSSNRMMEDRRDRQRDDYNYNDDDDDVAMEDRNSNHHKKRMRRHSSKSRSRSRSRSHSRDNDRNRERSYSPSSSHRHYSDYRDFNRDRSGRHYHYHNNHYSRDRSSRDYHRDSKGRREYSSLHSRRDRDSYHYSRGAGSSATRRRKAHAFEKYVHQPLLCRHLWEIEHQELNNNNDHKEQQQQLQQVGSQEKPLNNEVSAETEHKHENEHDDEWVNGQQLQDKDQSEKEEKQPQPEEQPQQQQESYDDYVQKYCLDYVQTFFNHHIDDQWFRQRYSPLEFKRFVQKERNRASKEAFIISQEIQHATIVSSSSSTTTPTSSFVMDARLGGGVKPFHSTNNSNYPYSTTEGSSTLASSGALTTSRKRKYNSTSDAPATSIVIDPTIPQSHLISFLKDNKALRIVDIPSYLNDTQLLNALKDHCDENQANDTNGETSSSVIGNVYPIEIYSSSVVDGICSAVSDNGQHDNSIYALTAGSQIHHSSSSDASFYRSAWAIFESEAAKEKMLNNLLRANLDAHRYSRDSRDLPKHLELDVDWSDPYGRFDVDSDGHGGNTVVDEVTGSKTVVKAPLSKRLTVFVETKPPVKQQQTIVLSAAVSSTKRIQKDCHVAITIAKRMDITRGIPSELRCQTVLKKLFPSIAQELIQGDGFSLGSNDSDKERELKQQLIEDTLDVTIAYLRRVHLFTFYNGCTFADHIGALISGTHPAAAIHLRLKGADEILKKTREENADMYDDLPMAEDNDVSQDIDDTTKADSAAHSAETKDMLVMRLDDSIEKVLQHITTAMETPSPFVVNEFVDAVASEIQSSEEKAKLEWINNHAVIDSDGRARCSFHFCNKLFKDKNFLQKHLLKKHSEYLQAEMAKGHDSYMMDWWEKEEHRPVPQICVDCGPKFGYRLSSVVGAVEPTAHDPEPELWHEEQEHRRKIEEEEERHREKRAASESMDRRRMDHVANSDDLIDAAPVVTSNFIDVDDMKDEKVELSFENVVTPVPTKSKKKKKRKLL